MLISKCICGRHPYIRKIPSGITKGHEVRCLCGRGTWTAGNRRETISDWNSSTNAVPKHSIASSESAPAPHLGYENGGQEGGWKR